MVNESRCPGTLRETLILRRSPTRGDNRKAPVAWVVADFWPNEKMLPAPPLQKTSTSASHLPPKSDTRAKGDLERAIWAGQAFTCSVVAADRNRKVSLDAVWYPAKKRVT